MTVQTGDNKFSVSKWIVDPIAGLGTHTTIQGAIDSAVAGESIFVRPATYTEDLILKAGVSIQSFVGNENPGLITIVGKCSFSETGNTSLVGIHFTTNSDFSIEVSGANASILTIENCFFEVTNNIAINFSSSNSSSMINIFECEGDLTTTGIAYFSSSSPGRIAIENSVFTNSGNSVTTSTISAGRLVLETGTFSNPITSSGTGAMQISRCNLGSVGATTMITDNGSVDSTIRFSFIASGTASAISIGAASTLRMFHTELNSTNANIVTGAGRLLHSSIISRQTGALNPTTLDGNENFLGIMRSPVQPAFLAVLPSTVNNVTGNGTPFQLGTSTALTEIFDQSNNFNTNGTFIAPVTGKYSFTGYFLMNGITNSMDDGDVTFVTSNRTYKMKTIDVGSVDTPSNELSMGGTIFADMNAGDTCTFNVTLFGGTLVADVFGDGTPTTFFSGYLVF